MYITLCTVQTKHGGGHDRPLSHQLAMLGHRVAMWSLLPLAVTTQCIGLAQSFPASGKTALVGSEIKINLQDAGPKKPDTKENVLYDSIYIKCRNRTDAERRQGGGLCGGRGRGTPGGSAGGWSCSVSSSG